MSMDRETLEAAAELASRGALGEAWSEASRKAAAEARRRKGHPRSVSAEVEKIVRSDDPVGGLMQAAAKRQRAAMRNHPVALERKAAAKEKIRAQRAKDAAAGVMPGHSSDGALIARAKRGNVVDIGGKEHVIVKRAWDSKAAEDVYHVAVHPNPGSRISREELGRLPVRKVGVKRIRSVRVSR